MSEARSSLEQALSFDMLAEAEKITGRSYKDDDSTTWLGMALGMHNGVEKRALLEANNDTHSSQPLAEWIAVVKSMGFHLLHEQEVPGTADKFRMWWKPGLLLVSDSYRGDKVVNGAKVYFNYRGPRGSMYRCSSGWAGEQDGVDVWEGSYDAREGLRFALERMEAAGEFLPVWVKAPFLWLLHYADSKAEGYDYKAINAQRIALLPEEVRAAISPDSSLTTD